MPTPLKCTNCGAPLSVPDGARRITCTYCGATSELKAERPPEAARAPEPSDAGHARPVAPRAPARPAPPKVARVERPARPPRSDGAPGCGPAFGIAAALGVVVVVLGAVVAGGPGVFDHMQWNGTRAPMLVDIDGDGSPELVGLVRFLDGGESVGAVAAFDAGSGRRRWATRFGDAEPHALVLAAAGGRLWLADGTGQLRALDPATGTVVATTRLGEKPERFCGDGAGGLRVRLRDRVEHAVDLRTGAVTRLGEVQWDAPCPAGFWTSEPGSTPTTTLTDHSSVVDARKLLPEALAAGLSAEALFTVTGGPSYVLAEKRPGTRVPLVVARDALGTPVWTADVPAGDPLVAEEGAPEVAGLGPGRLYVPWDLKKGETPKRIAAFDAATGRRVWDATLPDDTGDVGAIVADERRVYVSVWTWLVVFDAATGEPLHTIGRW